MAVKKYYAWTRILLTPEVDSTSKTIMQPAPVVNAGDEVNASKLGVSQSEFDALIKEGVVRTRPFPTTKRYETAKEAMRRKAIAELELAESGGIIDDFDTDDDSAAVINDEE